jgi:hypothetical protein
MIWLIGWILLWFRPEYKFVLFFGFGLIVLDLITFAFFGGVAAITNPGLDLNAVLAFLDAYFANAALTLAIFFAVGAAIVALRKWMKARKSGGDKNLDNEMERIRAEIAARDGKPPAAS